MGASNFSPDRLKSILLDKRPCNFDMPGFDDGVHFSTDKVVDGLKARQ